MTAISRIYTFANSSMFLPSQLEDELFSIVNQWNNHEKGVASFTSPVMKNLSLKGSGSGSAARILFYSSDLSLTSQVGYIISNFVVLGDATNGLNLSGGGGNICLGDTSGSYGGGTKVLFIPNRSVAPSTNPTGGGILYAESGALKWRGSAGTTTTIAAA